MVDLQSTSNGDSVLDLTSKNENSQVCRGRELNKCTSKDLHIRDRRVNVNFLGEGKEGNYRHYCLQKRYSRICQNAVSN